jgi:hypothetical protein
MNLYLTCDYELFFGKSTGTIEKWIIQPTKRLLELSKKHSMSMTFFVYVGYIIKLTTCLKDQLTKGRKEMVIIGHPKSMTNYSFKKLDNFLNENAQKHVFTTFNSLK